MSLDLGSGCSHPSKTSQVQVRIPAEYRHVVHRAPAAIRVVIRTTRYFGRVMSGGDRLGEQAPSKKALNFARMLIIKLLIYQLRMTEPIQVS